MSEYVKNIVVNFNEDGSFASATKLVAGATGPDGEGNTVPVAKPNESIDLAEVRSLIPGD